ncbi:MAG: hypothetical protein JWP03_1151 [Phycisphaerales bacterium]|nr:hypothetical protein [Phycisphaerales bacterium]
MGISQRKKKKSGGETSAGAVAAAGYESVMARAVVVNDATGTNAPGGPDAASLRPNEFPLRILPKITGKRESCYQVIFRQSVLEEIHRHGKGSTDAEVCGVLVGNVYQDITAPWAYVEHCIRGNGAIGKQTQVTITSETWTRIHETLEAEYPGKRILGWYHTHPGFGIFLSGMDLFIQDNFFNTPWQIAFVYDPIGTDEGVFLWRGGKSVREDFLVERDVEPTPDGAQAPEAITELARRLRTVERRIKALFTAFLFVVLAAIVLPMLLYVFGVPDWLPLPAPRGGAAPTTQRAVENAVSGFDGVVVQRSTGHGTTPDLSRAGKTTLGRPATGQADFDNTGALDVAKRSTH